MIESCMLNLPANKITAVSCGKDTAVTFLLCGQRLIPCDGILPEAKDRLRLPSNRSHHKKQARFRRYDKTVYIAQVG